MALDGLPVEDAAWPTAARRLLELLLCLPDYRATAQQAERQELADRGIVLEDKGAATTWRRV